MSENINELIYQLSQKIGTSPEQLSSAADRGELGSILSSSQNPQARQAADILSDPEQTKKLLESPQAQALMKMLGGK